MKSVFALKFLVLATALAGCNEKGTSENPATLYRNSGLESTLRVHVATFDADEPSNLFNISNCQMTARLLNSNVSAQPGFEGPQTVGFWCEPGRYNDEGLPPITFDAEFPTDSQ